MSRFQKWALRAGVTLVVLAIGVQAYVGAADLVTANRRNCERTSQNLAAIIDHIRIDEQADVVVAHAKGVPPMVRTARKRQLRQQNRQVLIIDSHVDRGVWPLLRDPRDQRAVRYGVGNRPPFRCDNAFPSASLIHLWG